MHKFVVTPVVLILLLCLTVPVSALSGSVTVNVNYQSKPQTVTVINGSDTPVTLNSYKSLSRPKQIFVGDTLSPNGGR